MSRVRVVAAVASMVSLLGAAAPAHAAAPVMGLRGVAVTALVCPTAGGERPSTMGDMVRVSSMKITSLTVCPQTGAMLPGATSTPAPKVLTLKKNKGRFVALVAALSLPDVKAKTPKAGETPMPCPMYADVERFVYATTTTGTWLLHIPTDKCGHFQAAALKMLAQVDPTQKAGA